jgi:stage II sporulation protein D (peptidoglycan lytic transglycosylase)
VRARGDRLEVNGARRGAPLRLEGPGPHQLEGRLYRGALEVRSGPGGLRVVNEVPIDAYVAGTLLAEVYPDWEEAALRAQAVATRTYALYRRARARKRGLSYDLEADPSGQVYRGVAAESPVAWRVVEATRGEYLSWEGEPILAVFHSASGGRTAAAGEVWGRPLPYLVSVPVEGEEDSPDTYWRTEVSAGDLEKSLSDEGVSVGSIRSVAVVERTPSGRVDQLRIVGARGVALVPARTLRKALGAGMLRSTLFEVRALDGSFVFVGSGRGHGAGMSQWGARALAKGGSSYREILARFYPGATLRHLAPAAPRQGADVAAGGLR